MLKIDRTSKSFSLLERKKLSDVGLLERHDIQAMIRNAPEAFCEEMGKGDYVWFVGEEVVPSETVNDRIDLLGVDDEGAVVIFELKRDSHKLHLLQALAYAAMVSKWDQARLVEELRKFNKKGQNFEQAKEELIDALEGLDYESINRRQRVVLIAEDFDYEVLVTAEWLWQQNKIDVRCFRLSLSQDGQNEYLSCTRVYPPPEITDLAIQRRGSANVAWSDWDQALQDVANPAVRDFFKAEIAAGRPNRIKRRYLQFKVGNKTRIRVVVRPESALVYQHGRFDDDEAYWRTRFGTDFRIRVIRHGQRLRFRLATAEQFAAFKDAWESNVSMRGFSAEPEDVEDAEDPESDA